MRRLIFAGALVAGAAGLCGAASAQQPPAGDSLEEMYCVYESLILETDYELVAEAFLYDDAAEADKAAAKKLVDDTAATCAAGHDMTTGQMSAMSEIGILGSAADYLADELMFEGVSETAIDGVFDVFYELSEDDQDSIYVGTWRDNPAVQGRIKSALLTKGVPDTENSIQTAYQILELSTMAMDSVMMFMLDDTKDDKP
jgi:hypothetical protein